MYIFIYIYIPIHIYILQSYCIWGWGGLLFINAGTCLSFYTYTDSLSEWLYVCLTGNKALTPPCPPPPSPQS